MLLHWKVQIPEEPNKHRNDTVRTGRIFSWQRHIRKPIPVPKQMDLKWQHSKKQGVMFIILYYSAEK
jgi:hypothetical protein